MRFSILHISDLHRDLADEVNNEWLLDSLETDFRQFESQTPAIQKPMMQSAAAIPYPGPSPLKSPGLALHATIGRAPLSTDDCG
jgi:hypothetical protein